MVSGFFTSPCDHSRIFSGLASEIRIAEKLSGSFGFSKNEKMSRIGAPNFPNSQTKTTLSKLVRGSDSQEGGKVGRPEEGFGFEHSTAPAGAPAAPSAARARDARAIRESSEAVPDVCGSKPKILPTFRPSCSIPIVN